MPARGLSCSKRQSLRIRPPPPRPPPSPPARPQQPAPPPPRPRIAPRHSRRRRGQPARRRMTRFLQPEWFWLLTLLPLVMLWRGRRGPVAAIEYSDVGLAREVARRSRSRVGRCVWLLPIFAGALMIAGLARPQRGQSRTEVTVNGIDILLGLDVSGSMQALDFLIDDRRLNRIDVVKRVV